MHLTCHCIVASYTQPLTNNVPPIAQVLVHGEQNEMSRLKAALTREYEDDPNTSMELYNPRNTVSVDLYFKGEKTAKVMGELAVENLKPDAALSGIIVKRNFNYHLLAPSDLPSKYL